MIPTDIIDVFIKLAQIISAASVFGGVAGWVATKWISTTFLPRTEAAERFVGTERFAVLVKDVSHLQTTQEREHENLRGEIRGVKSTLDSIRDYLMRRGG